MLEILLDTLLTVCAVCEIFSRAVRQSLLQDQYCSRHLSARGGGVLSSKSYVDVPAGPRKSDYLYTNFLPNFPGINIPFSKEKHPILTKLGAFYTIWPKIHPIYVIWAPSSLMKTPPIAIPNFAKKRPKRQAHIRIPCQCENPPGSVRCLMTGKGYHPVYPYEHVPEFQHWKNKGPCKNDFVMCPEY